MTFPRPQVQVRVPLLYSVMFGYFGVNVGGILREVLYGRQPLPGIDYQAVRLLVPLARVLELIGFVPHESSGVQLRGPCPIHGSSSPRSRSFSANLGRNAYQCFKCGSTGNQLDLWAAVTKMDLHTATIDLCEKSQVDIPWIRKW